MHVVHQQTIKNYQKQSKTIKNNLNLKLNSRRAAGEDRSEDRSGAGCVPTSRRRGPQQGWLSVPFGSRPEEIPFLGGSLNPENQQSTNKYTPKTNYDDKTILIALLLLITVFTLNLVGL